MQAVLLDVGNLPVDHGGMDQQRRGGQPVVVVIETALILVAGRKVGEELFECLQHGRLSAADADNATAEMHVDSAALQVQIASTTFFSRSAATAFSVAAAAS